MLEAGFWGLVGRIVAGPRRGARHLAADPAARGGAGHGLRRRGAGLRAGLRPHRRGVRGGRRRPDRLRAGGRWAHLLHRRRRSSSPRAPPRRRRRRGLAIVLGALLDGLPESFVLGASLVGGPGVSVSFLVAVLLSNLPEGLAGRARPARRRATPRAGSWACGSCVAIASGVAAAIGFALLGSMPREPLGIAKAFAAGAILTMLADTMFPEAYEDGGNGVGLATVLGFALAFFLSAIARVTSPIGRWSRHGRVRHLSRIEHGSTDADEPPTTRRARMAAGSAVGRARGRCASRCVTTAGAHRARRRSPRSPRPPGSDPPRADDARSPRRARRRPPTSAPPPSDAERHRRSAAPPTPQRTADDRQPGPRQRVRRRGVLERGVIRHVVGWPHGGRHPLRR